MESLSVARGIYEYELDLAEGRHSADLARSLHDRAVRLRDVQGDVRSELGSVLEQESLSLDQINLDEVVRHLEDGAKDLTVNMGEVNPTLDDLPAGIAGQAHLGTQGTETVDGSAIQGGDRLIDPEMARGVAEHERFHTKQRQPDAPEVDPNTEPKVSQHDFLEAGAIAAQLEVAPKSFVQLSKEYKELYRRALQLQPDRARLKELSREGRYREFLTLAA